MIYDIMNESSIYVQCVDDLSRYVCVMTDVYVYVYMCMCNFPIYTECNSSNNFLCVFYSELGSGNTGAVNILFITLPVPLRAYTFLICKVAHMVFDGCFVEAPHTLRIYSYTQFM